MSTSDQIPSAETALASAAAGGNPSLPDVATLTQMANAFFRALPGQENVGTYLQSPAAFSSALPLSESHLPQFGAPAPSLPALPSLDKLPTEADLARLSGTGFPTEGSALGVSPIVSSYDIPASASPQKPVFSQSSTGYDSPFSLPLPDFDLAFPSFEASLPNIPALPALANDDLAKSALSFASPLYFLEHAGALSQPVPSAPFSPNAPQQAQVFEPIVSPELSSVRRQFDVASIRRDFPILNEKVNGKPLIWLDNAATTQKPQAVIDRLAAFYSRENSNIHRAAHELAARATDAYEGARRTVSRFIGAGSAEEIVFVRGTTEAINLVAKAWGPAHLRAGDEIVISHLEHHANIVPWQTLAEQTGAVLKVIPVDDDGQILLDKYTALLSDRTKFVAVTQLSNALGTIVPVEQVIELGHRVSARVLIDAAQSVPHMAIDVTALDADFLVFSGHKLFGPTGIGILYGKREVLEDMPPWEGGGNMITDVTLERSTFQPPPGRFEAGTGNIADAAGLAAAIEYVERIGLPNIAAYEHALLEHATTGLRAVPGLRLIGTAANKASIVSFVLDGYEPTEVGTALNERGIAVRAGHHCAQPILRRYGLEATVRPSFAFYNTHDEVDVLVETVHRLSDRRGRR
jgi:cysteine desulfurase / selenocysteine lyase